MVVGFAIQRMDSALGLSELLLRLPLADSYTADLLQARDCSQAALTYLKGVRDAILEEEIPDHKQETTT